MKNYLIGLLAGIASLSLAQEYLNEGFDSILTTNINKAPGWEASGAAGQTCGVVSVARSLSRPNALELPEGTGPSFPGSSAIFTNFTFSFGSVTNSPFLTANPFLTISLWIYRENLDQRLLVRLGTNGVGMVVTHNPPDGTILVSNEVSHLSYSTTAKWVTNRFTKLTLHFNGADRYLAVDYDHTNVLAWLSANNLPFVNHLGLWRGLGAGRVFADNVEVRTFATPTLGWWRFDEPEGVGITEEVGMFLPTRVAQATAIRVSPPVDRLFDGSHDVRNSGALAAFQLQAAGVRWPVPYMRTWTVEAFVRFDLGLGPDPFLTWSEVPVQVTNSYLSLYFGSSHLWAVLRDMVNYGAPAYHDMGPVPVDSKWHHLALVKDLTALRMYVDYALISERPVSILAEDFYNFKLNYKMVIGEGLGGVGARSNHFLDELRISRGSLSPAQFLRNAHPDILLFSRDASPGQWRIRFNSIPGQPHWVETASDAGGQWGTNATLQGSSNSLTTEGVLTLSGDRKGIRIRRASR